MPSPQIENGHLDLANEIAEQFCRSNLSPGEWRVLWAVLRKTYGWHKKTDRISYAQFQKITGLDRWHIRRYLNRLLSRNIITKTGSVQRLEYGFQKDYSKWQPLPKQATVTTVAQTGYEPLPKQATVAVAQTGYGLSSGVKQYIKTTNKRYSANLSNSLPSLFSKVESFFKPEEIDRYKQEFLEYWTEKSPGGRKERWQMERVFDVKRRFSTWLRNHKRWSGQDAIERKVRETDERLKNWGAENA